MKQTNLLKVTFITVVLVFTQKSLCDLYSSNPYPWRSDSTGTHMHRHIKHKHTKQWHRIPRGDSVKSSTRTSQNTRTGVTKTEIKYKEKYVSQ